MPPNDDARAAITAAMKRVFLELGLYTEDEGYDALIEALAAAGYTIYRTNVVAALGASARALVMAEYQGRIAALETCVMAAWNMLFAGNALYDAAEQHLTDEEEDPPAMKLWEERKEQFGGDGTIGLQVYAAAPQKARQSTR